MDRRVCDEFEHGFGRPLVPRRILSGHGEGIDGAEAPLLLAEALATARRRIPRWLLAYLRMVTR